VIEEQPAAPDQPEAPAPVLPFQPGQARPLTDDQVKAWRKRIEHAETKAKLFHPQWERALKRYAEALVRDRKTTINALLDFRHVESKKHQLFHRTPEINLMPVDPQDTAVPYDQILPLREKALNFELGPERANAKRAIHKTLIDTIAASAWMACEVGYEQVALTDPVTQAQVPVWSRRFISALSSKRTLVPADFYDTDFDHAPWLAYRHSMSLSQTKQAGWTLPADYTGTVEKGEDRYTHDLPSDDACDPKVPYVKVWYRASLFDPTVFNPELYRCLVLVDGVDQPAWHVDSPFQTLLPTGELSDDSMIGNPIHMGTIRDLIDSAYVPSDLVVGEQLSEEINQFRTELMRNRRKRQPHTFVSAGLGQDTINKIGENTGPIALPEDQFDGAGNVRGVAVTQAGTEPRDNYTAQEYAERDYREAFAISANQTGQETKKKITATESRIVQGNSSARAENEKDRVREWAAGLFRKFDVVWQRTATRQELVKILGQQGAMLWGQWQNLPGKYAYKIQPDSGQYVDAKEYRSQKLDEYNLLRKDPLVNAAELVRTLVRSLGYDAGKLVPQDQAEEKPEPLKLSASVSLEQALMVPGLMQLVLSMLQQDGREIPPELAQMLTQVAQLRQMVQAAQDTAPQGPEHPGAADRTEPLNKHQRQKTGGVNGVAA
jgi:hypothetical protein